MQISKKDCSARLSAVLLHVSLQIKEKLFHMQDVSPLNLSKSILQVSYGLKDSQVHFLLPSQLFTVGYANNDNI